uniref:Uncharacterized protein n=1 Tax=Rhizophora mucronata TaxID=61149 RepID=A0A2P2Q679_RHIMU
MTRFFFSLIELCNFLISNVNVLICN